MRKKERFVLGKRTFRSQKSKHFVLRIIYTAITRAKEKLKIYWSPETEKRVLENMKVQFNDKDYRLFKEKFKSELNLT